MNAREKRFCEEYLIDLNAAAAARRAGYKGTTAEGAAKWINPTNPKKPRLRAHIDDLAAERSKRTGISADRVLRELARVGFADLTDAVDAETGKLRPDVSEDDRAAIASIRVKRGDMFDEYEVRAADKLRALELIGKHLGMFRESVSLTVEVPQIVDIDGDGDG